MSNMSYCRFQNTVGDLRDCAEALDDIMNGEERLSREELAAARRLVALCQQIAEIEVEEDLSDDVLENDDEE